LASPGSGRALPDLITDILDVAKIEAGADEYASKPVDLACSLHTIDRYVRA
jgi:hypothetical protein